MGRRLVKDFDAFVVHPNRLARREESLVGPRAARIGRLAGAHHPQHAVVGENRRAAAVGERIRPAAQRIRKDCVARARQLFVAADEIRTRVGVDDVARRQIGQLLQRYQHLVRGRRSAGVDQHDAIRPDLHADIPASPGEHVEVLPDLDHLEPGVRLGGADRQHAAERQRQKNRKDSLHSSAQYT